MSRQLKGGPECEETRFLCRPAGAVLAGTPCNAGCPPLDGSRHKSCGNNHPLLKEIALLRACCLSGQPASARPPPHPLGRVGFRRMEQPFAAPPAPPAGWAVLDRAPDHAAYPPGQPAPVAAGAAPPGTSQQQATCPVGWCAPPSQQPAPLYPALYASPLEPQQQHTQQGSYSYGEPGPKSLACCQPPLVVCVWHASTYLLLPCPCRSAAATTLPLGRRQMGVPAACGTAGTAAFCGGQCTRIIPAAAAAAKQGRPVCPLVRHAVVHRLHLEQRCNSGQPGHQRCHQWHAAVMQVGDCHTRWHAAEKQGASARQIGPNPCPAGAFMLVRIRLQARAVSCETLAALHSYTNQAFPMYQWLVFGGASARWWRWGQIAG